MLFVGGCMSPVDGPITDEEGNLFPDNPALGLDYADPMNTEYVPGAQADGGPALTNNAVGNMNDDFDMQGQPMTVAEGGETMTPDPETPEEPTEREIRLMNCGDGVVNWENGETCDDGGINSRGCRNDCLVDVGFYCEGEPSVCASKCGDGVLAWDEACDDGNFNDGDGCGFACFVEEGFECTNSPSVCGPLCGDGLAKGDEICDDGNLVDGDGCNATCEAEPGYECNTGTCLAICGDGFLLPQEACDDGNLDADDGCSEVCTLEPGFECHGEPSMCEEKHYEAVCGDGVVEIEAINPEQCDDGNEIDGDGCSSCVVDPFFQCEGEPSLCIEIK